MKRLIFSTLTVSVVIVLSACAKETAQSNVAVADAPQPLESTPTQTGVNDATEMFSSDQLGLCFRYPEGYTLTSANDSVGIVAPFLPGAGDTAGRFWLEISDSYERSAERIADEDMTYATDQQGIPRANLDWWGVTIGGVQAVVLDGMPGQDLQRRIYAVRDQTLYVLAFSPTRSENKAIGDQLETLYTTVTNSWSWSPCSASE